MSWLYMYITYLNASRDDNDMSNALCVMLLFVLAVAGTTAAAMYDCGDGHSDEDHT